MPAFELALIQFGTAGQTLVNDLAEEPLPSAGDTKVSHDPCVKGVSSKLPHRCFRADLKGCAHFRTITPSTMFNTGAKVREIIAVRVSDVRILREVRSPI